METDEERLDFVQMEIEEVYFDDYPHYVSELDKSWDALHRSLTDGKLEYTNGSFPNSHVVLGGELLYFEEDYIMSLKTPDQVKQIALTVNEIKKDDLRKGYVLINEDDYGFPLEEGDFEYTWEWFTGSFNFWKLAASENRYVLFTADQ